jgi:hypothetical protein
LAYILTQFITVAARKLVIRVSTQTQSTGAMMRDELRDGYLLSPAPTKSRARILLDRAPHNQVLEDFATTLDEAPTR